MGRRKQGLMTVVGTEQIRLVAGEARRIERAVLKVSLAEGQVVVVSRQNRNFAPRCPSEVRVLKADYEEGDRGDVAHSELNLKGAEDVRVYAGWGDVELGLVYGKAIREGS